MNLSLHLIALIDPDAFQSIAFKWIAAVSAVLTALLMAAAALWSKVSEIKDRMDRQSQKTGSLQDQVTRVALQTTPPVSVSVEPPKNP